MDVNIRLLRYFMAVAEEGSVTGAAQRLYVSQPALTNQLRQLEAQLRTRLFERSHNGMALTEPGRVLAEQVPALLAKWDNAVRETKGAASRAAQVLRVGFMASAANEATQDIVAAFGRARPGWKIDMRQGAWDEPTAGLATGDVDVAFLRLPFPGQEAMRVRVLLTEPRLVALRSAHPLATREEIPFQDLLDEPFVAAPTSTGTFRDYWLATEERGGRPARIGAVTAEPDEWLNAIANGYGIALAPESAARFYGRPGITYRKVTGVPASQVAVAWSPAADPDQVIQDFVRCCQEYT